MADVRIYTTEGCPFCHSAKVLLRSRSIPYEEIDLPRRPKHAIGSCAAQAG